MSLKNLLALQQQKKAATETAKAATLPHETSSPEAESNDKHPGQVTPTAEPEKPKGLGLNIAGTFKKSDGPIPTKTPAAAKANKPKVESGDFSLEDLAALDASEVAPTSGSSDDSEFDDEIEATAPDRDLPADLTSEQLNFVESLDGIYGVLHDPEMFGQAVRMVMIELQENPEYERLLSDNDVHTMIRGMRRTMGLARVRKQEKSRKASTNKNARKSASISDSAMSALDQLFGG